MVILGSHYYSIVGGGLSYLITFFYDFLLENSSENGANRATNDRSLYTKTFSL